MTRRSGLALAVLSLLTEEPMHPYRMQQLIRERGKDDVVNVGQRSQLYKTIDRLARDGLITEHATERETARPERTLYTVTDAGRETAADWTREMLAAPRPEFPEFVVGLAHLAQLRPADAARALDTRLDGLRRRLAASRASHEAVEGFLPRVVVVELEYAITMLEAETAWVAALVDDVRGGRLTWDREELRRFAQRLGQSGDA
ncbi:PadR family transcriptional regulator [Pseudonocardia sp. EC080610-09]|uniref:PadR family transcriptional regulator n=1 Tax=unclassified Pseudonocardia TaxID=2619320 RepID=UPI0006CB5C45|nr:MULTISPECIES: PadR family transcriptional regulator [unclassified Pseudonocardia]ALE74900.1 PadR family transcriptional regulator [Pseudonocardia sp. EC080625-04]ALL74235.1 PadR family transcriptional regulator [Pseudonocardia sp. EC080610-09]ALL81258.1 PadR family transcriptional regulator [Pseudonocardia sp. EC080619-01]